MGQKNSSSKGYRECTKGVRDSGLLSEAMPDSVVRRSFTTPRSKSSDTPMGFRVSTGRLKNIGL